MRVFRCRFSSSSFSRKTRLASKCLPLNVEPLESRLVPTMSASFSAGLLTVTGDSSANAIAISFATVSSSKYIIVNSSSGLLFDGRPSASNILTANVTSISVASGDGGDYIDLTDVAAANGFSGLNGNITLQGGSGDDGFAGSEFGDVISAFGGNDVIESKAGNDSVNGGSGDDTYIYYGTSLGSDLITEASNDGADAITFALFATGITIDLSSTTSQSVGGSTSIQLSSATGIEGIVGSVYGDSVTGNARDNIIIGGGGNDTMAGGAGNDTYSFYSDPSGTDAITESDNSDNDTLDFSGCDVGVTIDFSSTSSQAWGDGSIALSSSSGIESFTGSNYNDSFTGNSRNNLIVGNAGNDTLAGGGGDDSYVFGSAANGSDVITESASADADTLFFNLADVAVVIDLSSTSPQSWGDGTLQISSTTSIENVFGSQFSDSITGNAANNSLVGGSGDDTLIGADGDDSLIGEGGNDSMVGGAGSDIYNFDDIAQGSDTIVESANLDTDALIFENTDVAVTINLSSTSSQSWGDGTIALSSSTGIEAIQGGAYNDSLTGNDRGNTIYGGGGNDTMSGGLGTDLYLFGATAQGSDVINEDANVDNDALGFGESSVAVTIDLSSTSSQSWGNGSITLSNNSAIESILGSSFADMLTGNASENFIEGSGGNDTIYGAGGSDYINGGEGDDSMQGGSGNDSYRFLFAGIDDFGSDTIDESSSTGSDSLDFSTSSGGIIIDLSSTSAQNWGFGTITLLSSTGIENVSGSIYADSIAGNSRPNFIDADAGNDTISGGDGDDQIFGREGNDSIDGGAGSDTLFGDEGDDILIGGTGSDIYGFAGTALGSDSITEASSIDSDGVDFADAGSAVNIDISSTSSQSWGAGTITLSTTDGIEGARGSDYADSLAGNNLDNILLGGGGNDTITGAGGNDIISGDVGADSLSGGSGEDAILGGDGNDIIQGGADRDIVAGGDGSDSVSGDGGSDIVIAGNVASPLGDAYILLTVGALESSWGSASSYADRVGDVTGDSMAPAPLPYGARLVKNETLFDDSDSDVLTGGSDNDVFFFDNGEDTLSDIAIDEVMVDIG